MKCGIHVYVCHDVLSMQCLYALLDLSWCGTAQNTERRTLVSHTVYTCKLLSFDLFLFFDSIGNMDNGMTHAVVMKLADSLKNRGHHVYTDILHQRYLLICDPKVLEHAAL